MGWYTLLFVFSRYGLVMLSLSFSFYCNVRLFKCLIKGDKRQLQSVELGGERCR